MRLSKIALLPLSSDTHPGRWISYEDVEHTLLCVLLCIGSDGRLQSENGFHRQDLTCVNGCIKEWNMASLLNVFILQNWFKCVTPSPLKATDLSICANFLMHPDCPAQPSGNFPVDFPLETGLNLACVLKKRGHNFKLTEKFNSARWRHFVII